MAFLQADCVLCERVLQRRSELPWDRPLTETADFVVVPTKGALLPGWLLVVAKEHVLCSGALRRDNLDAFGEAVADTRRLVERRFGPATLFEHGPMVPGTNLGCGVDHLHIHVAPLAFSLRGAFEQLYPDTRWNTLPGWEGLGPLHAARIPYVAVEEPGRSLVWCAPPPGVRQPLRRAIAEASGIGERFDYHSYPHSDNVDRTIALLTA